ncbi:competence protein CoiA family protein [Streptomyces thinghirensis]|uniref:Competence protein CoiA nuclease-like domain-containing protein n=2 Tax=Streptomyces thinghirensis TaxID=551547 RepID=A0ABP9TDD4_9ACTN
MAHHLLKLELSTAARAAGGHVELEVRGPDGAWRADVMASDPDGSWRIALEAQLSPITPDDIEARTARMLADGVRSVWFSDRPRPPWLGLVPSVRLEAVDGGGLDVAEGLVKFFAGWWEAGPRVPVAEFLRWVFGGRVIPHLRQRPTMHPLEALHTVWTAPQYIRQESVHVAETARQEQERQQHEAAINALLERQEALKRPSVEFVYQETGVSPHVAKAGTPEFAMGVPVYVRGEPYAIICPVASRVPALRRRLSRLILLAASERERQRIAAQAGPGQRIVALQPDQAAKPSVPQQVQPDTVTVRQAVTRMFGLDRT